MDKPMNRELVFLQIFQANADRSLASWCESIYLVARVKNRLKIWQKIHDRWRLHRHVIPFAGKNRAREITAQNTLCLFCHPRGGSTWLTELLLQLPDSVLIDEPLWRGPETIPFAPPQPQHYKVPAIADLDFFHYQYIPDDAEWPAAKEALGNILRGAVPSLGLYDEQPMNRLKNSGLYITKFCYAHLLMPWLMHQFDVRAILFTRHPCSVIASQLQHPSWQYLRAETPKKIAKIPWAEFYADTLRKAGKIDSPVKYLAIIWALAFRATAMHPANNQQWLTMAYEGLVANPAFELNRLQNKLSINISPREEELARPSNSTIASSLNRSTTDRLTGWRHYLDKKQIRTIFEVLDKFEIDLYNERPEPDYNRLYKNEILK